MVSWSTIQSILLFAGPYIYSKGKQFYLAHRTRTPPVPLPRGTQTLLNILFITGLLALLSTFDFFGPENVFVATNSRLQTPNDVLWNRVSKLRDLTESDELLRSRLGSKEGRLLYAAYGPAPLAECTWCKIDEPNTFLFYALPAMALPHLLHIAILGIVTSSSFSTHGTIWRTQATIASAGLFLAELYLVGVSSGDYVSNRMARGSSDITWTHWKVRLYRGVSMALIDALLGYAVWLSGTRRWTFGLEGRAVQERLEMMARGMESIGAQVQTAHVLRQALLRDKKLTDQAVEFWRNNTPGLEVIEDEEVASVLAERNINMETLQRNADSTSTGLMESMAAMRRRRNPAEEVRQA